MSAPRVVSPLGRRVGLLGLRVIGALLALIASGVPALPGLAEGGEGRAPGTLRPASLATCDAAFETHPHLLDTAFCYSRYADQQNDREGAIARLEQLVATHPDNPMLLVALADALPRESSTRALGLYAAAVEELEHRELWQAAATAYGYRSFVHLRRREFDAARRDGERAEELAGKAGDESLVLFGRLQAARPSLLKSDYARAWGLLRSIELHPAFEDASVSLRGATLDFLGLSAANLGLDEAALRYRERLVELGEQASRPDWISSGSAGMAFIASRLVEAGKMSREEAYPWALRGVESAPTPWARRWARSQLAALAPWEEAEALLRELSAQEDPIAINVHQIYGSRLREEEPERADEATAHFQRALEIAKQGRNVQNVATAFSYLSDHLMRTGGDDEAFALAERTLDAIEVLQDLQSAEAIGALSMLRYARSYDQLVDAWVRRAKLGEVGALERAFAISERFRARLLLQHMQRLGAPSALEEDERERVEDRLRRVSELQKKLLAGEGEVSERAAWEREIIGLEEEVRVLRGRVVVRAGQDERYSATVEEVQETLAADQALISFIVSSDPSITSWALLVTPAELRAFPIPTRFELESASALWLGLLAVDDPAEARGAARLFEEVLAAPLAALPAGIRRVVLVPDGALHSLPFDALRPGPAQTPIAERFELTLAPSASVWRLLREREHAPGSEAEGASRALFVADPWLPSGTEGPALLRSLPLGAALGPLPHARREARHARRALGGRVEVLEGRGATEAALEASLRGDVRLLHFAAHSLVDAGVPERSSVVMSPEGDDDGLLQAREVLELRLGGALVALSACQSATGQATSGEGVLGLSRAFFRAGASAVIGSLWPVRDADTAAFMRIFYERIAEGVPPSRALAEAKRAMAREGRLASAWSGFVLIGAADEPLRPEPERTIPAAAYAWPFVLLALLALGFLYWFRRLVR